MCTYIARTGNVSPPGPRTTPSTYGTWRPASCWRSSSAIRELYGASPSIRMDGGSPPAVKTGHSAFGTRQRASHLPSSARTKGSPTLPALFSPDGKWIATGSRERNLSLGRNDGPAARRARQP